MSSKEIDLEYFKEHGNGVVSAKELPIFHLHICDMLRLQNFSYLNSIMNPDNVKYYSILLCVSLLRSTWQFEKNIHNWTKFKLMTQYKAYYDESIENSDLKTMFMGL